VNGSEVETRKPVVTKFSYNQESAITPQEKMDLMVFSSTPMFATFCKMIENIIIRSRNHAMEVDPANDKAQTAALTIARAQKDLYEELRGDIEFSMGEHMADVRARAAQEDLKDQKKVEEIIFANVTGQK
jgi:hypothetical protein